MNKTIISVFFQHIKSINFSIESHIYVHSTSKVPIFLRCNFIYPIFIIFKIIVLPIQQKTFQMRTYISITNLIIGIYPFYTVIKKYIFMCMTANINKIIMIILFRTPIFFRCMSKNNCIFLR